LLFCEVDRLAESELGLQASDVQGAAVADDVHPYVRVYAQWMLVNCKLGSDPNFFDVQGGFGLLCFCGV
jgi:hypothetical protein